MRNLKRALSLGLTAAMISGLMVMGSSAASYTDSDEIQNQAAVEILGEIGVMVGNADGTFAPDRDVTRAEMAVIITRILYGENLNVDQFKGMDIFTDVPDWAEGFVNLCASMDIVAGVGDGKFDPNATVTTAQASLMLARALGYFQNSGEFGNDWALAAVRRATQAGIISSGMALQANEGLSRDNVAQMTFNTLTKAVPVQYNELLNVYYNQNQGITYSLTFNYLQTLGYKNFDLVYDNGDVTVYGRPATTWGVGTYRTTTSNLSGTRYTEELDANGGLIASRVQILEKDEIITITNEPTYVYTDATDEEDVYDDLGDARCNNQRGQKADEEYDWTVYVNGELQNVSDAVAIPGKNVSSDYAYTGKGAQTEIYVDDADQTVTVVEINYYIGEVANVREDSDGEYVVVRAISDLRGDGAKLDERTFYTSEFEKGDYVVFTIDMEDKDFVIRELMAPETATGTVTRVDWGTANSNAYLYLDGSDKYNYSGANHIVYDLNNENVRVHPALNEEYTLYLDPNGYVLAYSGDTTVRYLYVRNSDEEFDAWEAAVTFTDATKENITVDEVDGDDSDDYVEYLGNSTAAADQAAGRFGNFTDFAGLTWLDPSELRSYSAINTKVSNIDYQIWKYSTNDAGDLYDLKSVDNYYATVNINNGEAHMNSVTNNDRIVVDRDTIFVDTMDDVAYTGYDEVPDYEDAGIVYVMDGGVAEVVYIITGVIQDANKIYFTLANNTYDTIPYDGDEYYIFHNGGLTVDGEEREDLYVSVDAFGAVNTPAEFQTLVEMGIVFRVDQTKDESYITLITPMTNWRSADVMGNDALRLIESGLNGDIYHTDDETVIVLMEANYNSAGSFVDWDVAEVNDLDDVIPAGTADRDGYVSVVQVLKTDDQYAGLVYILNYIPEDLISGVAVKGLPVTFNAANVANVTLDYTTNQTSGEPKLEIGSVVPYAEIRSVTISGVAGNWTSYGDTTPYTVPGSRTIKINVLDKNNKTVTYTINLTINSAVVDIELNEEIFAQYSNAVINIDHSTKTITVSDDDVWTLATLKRALNVTGIIGDEKYGTIDSDGAFVEATDDTVSLYGANLVMRVERAEDETILDYTIVKTNLPAPATR